MSDEAVQSVLDEAENQEQISMSDIDPEVPAIVKRAIIQQDIRSWQEARYQSHMRWVVQKSLGKLGDVSAVLSSIEQDLARQEAAIEVLSKALAELDGAQA